MIKGILKQYIYPMAVFAGGTIGVGFLSLPYAAAKSGIFFMAGYFLLITFLIIEINLMFCDISLKTPDFKRFPGFVKYHLGKIPYFIATILMILGGLGVLLAYILVGSQFLASIFQPIFSGSQMLYALIYFLIVGTIIYFDIKLISKVQFWIIFLLFFSVILIFINGFSAIKLNNIFSGNLQNLFLPYGVLLFSLWGTGIIPEVEEMISKNKKNFKKIVTISTVIVSVFYFLFTILILSISGGQTSQTALAGLQKFLPNGAVYVCLALGVLTTIMAFIAQGIIFKKFLIFDLGIKHWQAFIITCFAPMALFLLGLNSFIPLVSLIGGFVLGIDGLMILLMYKKVGGKNFAIYPLFLVFLFGVIYEVVNFLK